MATTSQGLRYPLSSGLVRVHTDIKNLADDVTTIIDLPDDKVASNSGQSTITSTTGAALPTYPVSLTYTNPSSVYDLIVDVSLSAWLSVTANNVQAYVVASGGVSFGSTPAANGIADFGERLITSGPSTQCSTSFPVKIPAGAATVTFAVNAFRGAASGAQLVSYSVLRVRARRFDKP
jgi:hypothetical protein